jgi:hypothetical protein
MWPETIPAKITETIHTMTAPQVSACMALVLHYIEVSYEAARNDISPDEVEKAFIDSLRAIA